jgi:exo-beta-1,3-glucanase (GH17 family)
MAPSTSTISALPSRWGMTTRRRPGPLLLLAVLLLANGCTSESSEPEPPRPPPTTASSAPPITQGLGFSPFRDCQSPDQMLFPTLDQMKADVDLIRGVGNALRTYSSRNGMDEAAAYAQSVGLQVSAGAWLGPERTKKQRDANSKEIKAVIALARRIPLKSVIVGNEVLLRDDLTAERLAHYIGEVKAQVGSKTLVTTAEVAGELMQPQHRVVVDAVDYLMVHVHPYWDEVAIDGAAWYVADVFRRASEAAGKPAVLGETGWPSAGPPKGRAQPSLENARRFLTEWHAVAADRRIDYYYFAAFDEPWKQESGVGAHWGLMTKDRRPKHAMTSLRVQPGPLPPRPTRSPQAPEASAPGSTVSTSPRTADVSLIYTDWGKETTYVPSGWMGDWRRVRFDDCWRAQPYSGETAIRIAYSATGSGGKGWAGMYWQFPENNWGNKAGGKNLRRYRAITFHARGDRGGERLVFLTGGIPGRYGDSLGKREIAVTLSRDWRKYGIDLRGADLRRVVGAFGWTASRADNPKGATFYLDDIQIDAGNPVPLPSNARRLCASSAAGVRYVVDGAHLCPSTAKIGRYAIGVDTSRGLRRWLGADSDALRMDYPGGQEWGTAFITAGDPVPQGQRPGEDFSGCHTLRVDLRSRSPTTVGVGMKDSTMPDDGSETKVAVPVGRSWATASLPLRGFAGVDLTRVYVVVEFVFGAGSSGQQVYFRNVRFMCRS